MRILRRDVDDRLPAARQRDRARRSATAHAARWATAARPLHQIGRAAPQASRGRRTPPARLACTRRRPPRSCPGSRDRRARRPGSMRRSHAPPANRVPASASLHRGLVDVLPESVACTAGTRRRPRCENGAAATVDSKFSSWPSAANRRLRCADSRSAFWREVARRRPCSARRCGPWSARRRGRAEAVQARVADVAPDRRAARRCRSPARSPWRASLAERSSTPCCDTIAAWAARSAASIAGPVHSGASWNDDRIMRTASFDAMSPPPWPPAPSLTTQKQPPPPVQKPQASSLRSRPPGFDRTEISSCIARPRAGQDAPCGFAARRLRARLRLVGPQELLAEQEVEIGLGLARDLAVELARRGSTASPCGSSAAGSRPSSRSVSRCSSFAGSKRPSTAVSAARMPATKPFLVRAQALARVGRLRSGDMKPRPRGTSRWVIAASRPGANLSGLLSLAITIVASARTSRFACARAASRSSRPCIVSRMHRAHVVHELRRQAAGDLDVAHAGARAAARAAVRRCPGRRGRRRRVRVDGGRRGRGRGGRRRRGGGAHGAARRRPALLRRRHDDGGDAVLRDGLAVLRPRQQRSFAQDRRRVVLGRRRATAARGASHAQHVAGDAQFVAGRQRMIASLADRPAVDDDGHRAALVAQRRTARPCARSTACVREMMRSGSGSSSVLSGERPIVPPASPNSALTGASSGTSL